MELHVLNELFDTVEIIDVFESFNWTDRYNEAGDFELIVIASNEMISTIRTDYYLYFQQSEHLMIIEDVEILTDLEDGNRIKVTGRSLESILDRRIILNKTTFKPNNLFKNAVFRILKDSMGVDALAWRKISNFIISDVNSGTLNSMQLEVGAQYLGENVYETIVDLCKLKRAGFKVVLTDDNKFAFSLYVGVDRTATNQSVVPVIFSPYFENISNTTYYRSVKTMKTINYVVGEEVGEEGHKTRERITVTRGGSKYTGLKRREMYTDARDISHKDEDDKDISAKDYTKLLVQRGKETITKDENSMVETFEGEVDYKTAFVYGVDYHLGDMVEVADIYGHETPARISEILFSFDEEGFSINPSFTVPDDEEIDIESN